MNQYKESFIYILSMILLMVSFQIISPHVKEIFSNHIVSANKKFTVVVDAGHGGFDSGKVGIDGTLEKDVNLMIAKKLEKLHKQCYSITLKCIFSAVRYYCSVAGAAEN